MMFLYANGYIYQEAEIMGSDELTEEDFATQIWFMADLSTEAY